MVRFFVSSLCWRSMLLLLLPVISMVFHFDVDNNIGDDFGIYVYGYALFLNQLTQ